jgi:hypothetical protein
MESASNACVFIAKNTDLPIRRRPQPINSDIDRGISKSSGSKGASINEDLELEIQNLFEREL